MTKLVIEQPGFGEDFTTAFGTDLEYIDHTKLGYVVPYKPNEYLDKYSVGRPFLSSDYTVYEVTGMRQIILAKQEDNQEEKSEIEEFNVSKRYKDFEALRQCLVDRWVGFFIPSIPPTKVIVSPSILLCQSTLQSNTTHTTAAGQQRH